MQILVTCTKQEPMVTIDSKDGDQNRGQLKKKGFFFRNDQNEFYAEALGAFADRLEKNPLSPNTLYQVDISVSLASWETERTHERVYKNQIRLNKINKVNFESV